jgi:23S rRNA pseudouridine955/2504/2580 synthase
VVSAVETVTVKEGEAGMRLDRWFRAHYPSVRHGELEKLLRTGQVRVGGGRAKANRRLEPGEEIRIPPLRPATDRPEKPKPAPRREDAAFLKRLSLFEDEAVLALNKPFGLSVQGGEKTSRHIDGMLAALEKDGERPRLVHRLDRDTGGVLILAKTRLAAARLSEAFRRHEVEKTYWALVAGAPRPRRGTIDLALAKKRGAEERMEADEDDAGKKAVSDYQIVEEAGTVSFLALRPRTGRTHQLRVHCAAIGAPIVGDGKYGGAKSRIEGVAPKLHLFCREMSFPHPASGRRLTLTAPLGGHMLETWRFFDFPADASVDWPDLE